MSALPSVDSPVSVRMPGSGPASAARRYFASDSRRGFQTALGLLWLLDGGLQFQSWMYSRQFPASLRDLASAQPGWIGDSITWAANLLGSQPAVFNTLFALAQVALGVGLLWRPTVRLAILASVAWALIVWWFGEGLGGLASGGANMLTGAPGAVILYAVIALAVWPSARPGGLLGARGVRGAWAALWLFGAYLWLRPDNRAAAPTHETLMMMTPAGMVTPAPMHWLTRLDGSGSVAAQGHGLTIAIVLAVLSVLVAIPVLINRWPLGSILLGIALALAYWVIGQSFGGLFYTPSATDPNSGPLLVLLGLVVYSLTPGRARAPGRGWGRTAIVAGGAASVARARRVRTRPRAAVLFSATAFVAIVALVVAALLDGPTTAPRQPVAAASPFRGLALTPPVPAPPIALRDSLGRSVSLGQYVVEHKAVVLTFISSDCALNCRLASELRQAMAGMGASERAGVQLVGISYDPRRDTRSRATAFLRETHLTGRLEFLIGSRAQLLPVWSEWNLSAAQSGLTLVYGINPSGEVVTSYSAIFSPQELVHDVRIMERR